MSVDEKPCIQALERAQGYIRLPNGRAVSGFAHEYERHGTTTLFAALETATGLVKHTSWLNQIECWFSILRRQTLQGASFVGVKQLREAIDHFISAYNALAAPFEWRKSEIKQQPFRDNIAYFCS